MKAVFSVPADAWSLLGSFSFPSGAATAVEIAKVPVPSFSSSNLQLIFTLDYWLFTIEILDIQRNEGRGGPT